MFFPQCAMKLVFICFNCTTNLSNLSPYSHDGHFG